MYRYEFAYEVDKSSTSSNEYVTYEGGEYKRTVYRQSSNPRGSPTRSEYKSAIIDTLADLKIRQQIIPSNQKSYMGWKEEESGKHFTDRNENIFQPISVSEHDSQPTVQNMYNSPNNIRRSTNSAASFRSSFSELRYGSIRWRAPDFPCEKTKGLTAVDIEEHFSPIMKHRRRTSEIGYSDTSLSCSSDNIINHDITTSGSSNASYLFDDNDSLSSNESSKSRHVGLFRFSHMRKHVKKACTFERKKKSSMKTELRNIVVPSDDMLMDEADESTKTDTRISTRQRNNDSDNSPTLSTETPQSSSTSYLNSDRSFSDESDATNNYTDIVRRTKRKTSIFYKWHNFENHLITSCPQNQSISFAGDTMKDITLNIEKNDVTSINICSLKADLLIKIFSFLPTTEICCLSQVCRKWYQLYLSTELWNSIKITNMARSNIDKVLNLLLQRLAFTSPSSCLCVKRIQLDGCDQLTDVGLNCIAMRCPELKALEIACCLRVTGGGIGKILSHCPNMAYMNLAGCDDVNTFTFSPSSGVTFGQHASFLEMRFVDFSECTSLNDAALKLFVSCASFLEFLYLRRCDSISNDGILAVAHNCTNLKEISLNDCYNISDFGIRSLVKGCTKLRYISLAKCAITDDSIKSVAKYSKDVRHLNLHECEMVTEQGIIALCSSCETLRSLDVSKCTNMTDSALYALARCKRLRKLCLKRCKNVTDAGLRKIATRCKKLRHLNLRECIFSFETYIYIKQHCVMCSIEHDRIEFC